MLIAATSRKRRTHKQSEHLKMQTQKGLHWQSNQWRGSCDHPGVLNVSICSDLSLLKLLLNSFPRYDVF